jgi:hypothetical protein
LAETKLFGACSEYLVADFPLKYRITLTEKSFHYARGPISVLAPNLPLPFQFSSGSWAAIENCIPASLLLLL